MRISKEKLLNYANESGFRAEILEKVWTLMNILKEVNTHSYLKDRLVLKGGTALNLFLFNLPRLSVDIDLNYVGQPNRDLMQEERPKVEQALKSVCENMGMQLVRSPNSHAGSKWELTHESALGFQGTLEVDLNYMYRVPLWEPKKINSVEVAGEKATSITVLTPEELAAGKLSALFSRNASRDLFDSHYLLHNVPLDKDKLKAAVIIYGIMGPRDFRQVSLRDISFDESELQRKLIPVLRKNELKSGIGSIAWAKKTTQECQDAVKDLINFSISEKEFLDEFYNNGTLALSKIIKDDKLIKNIEQHPLIRWRTQVLADKAQTFSEENSIKI